MKHLKYYIVIFCTFSFLTSCTSHKPLLLYNVNANNPLKMVAVLPMRNDTTDLDGPHIVRNKMIQALRNRSYVVQDVNETDRILRDRMGITLGGQLDMITAHELGKALGVQGVLYGTLLDFNEVITVVYNARKVRAKFKLVNTLTDETVWQRGLGVKSEWKWKSSGMIENFVASAIDKATEDDSDVPWFTLKQSVEYAVFGPVGGKAMSQALKNFLNYETTEMAVGVSDNIPWGPGPATVTMQSIENN